MHFLLWFFWYLSQWSGLICSIFCTRLFSKDIHCAVFIVERLLLQTIYVVNKKILQFLRAVSLYSVHCWNNVSMWLEYWFLFVHLFLKRSSKFSTWICEYTICIGLTIKTRREPESNAHHSVFIKLSSLTNIIFTIFHYYLNRVFHVSNPNMSHHAYDNAYIFWW